MRLNLLGASTRIWEPDRTDGSSKLPETVIRCKSASQAGRIPLKWSGQSSHEIGMQGILGSIALLILVIACINYISLSLTSSSLRKTEVGVHKISGAAASQLAVQFGMESMILTSVSMIVAVILVILFLPSLNSFTGRDLVI